MRDTFIELLIERKSNALLHIAKYILYILTAIFVIGYVVVGFLSILIAIVFGIAGYFISQRADVEYEYSFVEKELDIDVIYAKQKRKHLETFDLSKMEMMAPIHSYHLDQFRNRNDKLCDYSSGIDNEEHKLYAMYYAGEKKVILEPNQELIDAIAYIAPRKVFRD